MNCPKCKSERISVIDSRPATDLVRRRRKCDDCGARFSTVEIDADFYEVKIKKLQTESAPLDKRVAEIIMVCKGQHDFGAFPTLKSAVVAYIADRCNSPAERITYNSVNKVIWNAALALLDSMSSQRPSAFIRKVKNSLELHNRMSRGARRIDVYEAICVAFQDVPIKDGSIYINGFTEENTQFVYKRK